MTRFRRWLLLVAGQHPLEAALATWGAISGINILATGTVSSALTSLPEWMRILWSVLIVLAALTTITGLIIRRMSTMATGMYLFGSILIAYAAAILGTAGWVRGGSISGLLTIIGLVCLVRGRWLKEQDEALIKEINRNYHDEDQ